MPPDLRSKIERQRQKVSATLTGADVATHVAHLESLNKGLRLILSRLAPEKPAPPRPPRPVWNDKLKKWEQPPIDDTELAIRDLHEQAANFRRRTV